jgi:hypothetical protein
MLATIEPAIDWAGLFDDINITHRDHGRNVGKKHININCPFCKDDPSEHLTCSLEIPAYYCLRDPRHAGRGRGIIRLLMALGQDYHDARTLIVRHRIGGVAQRAEPRPPLEPRAWSRFEPATEKPRYLRYLEGRGFTDPIGLIRRYDLRYARNGKWAGRLLIPLTCNGTINGWTGRAINGLEPKYLSEGVGPYMPRPARSRTIIVEGPLDALAIAAATESLDISVIASCGKNLMDKRLAFLAAARDAKIVQLALDADNPGSFIRSISNMFSMTFGNRYAGRLRMPAGYKDPGSMTESEIIEWLSSAA